MRARGWTRVATAVSAGGVAVILLASGADAAPRIQVGTPSLVLADGAAVAVPVRVSCDPGTRPSVNVQISQRSGRQVASAFGSESDIVCDGTPKVVQVFVHAQTLAFSRGVAFVTASLFSCTGFPFPGPVSGSPIFGPPTSDCTAKSSRTTRMVPGIIQDSGQL